MKTYTEKEQTSNLMYSLHSIVTSIALNPRLFGNVWNMTYASIPKGPSPKLTNLSE